MLYKSSFALTSIALSVALTGCGFNVSPYGISATNVEIIKGQNIKPFSVASFDAANPELSGIPCRAAGSVSTPDKIPYKTYIERAFIDELKVSGAYSDSSPTVIKGNLQEIDFNSNIGAGKWVFKLDISANGKAGFTVESKYEFSTNWVADKACQQVAQAFAPAVQQLIKQTVSDARFKQLTK